jgi:hypothetical protein
MKTASFSQSLEWFQAKIVALLVVNAPRVVLLERLTSIKDFKIRREITISELANIR